MKKDISMKKAGLSDLETVSYIVKTTVSTVYPHYYPAGAVEFFLKHHSAENISGDIEENRVFLCFDAEQNAVGTVTVKENEICRLFVLPQQQEQGYGNGMLSYAENMIFGGYSEIRLDASWPAKKIYQQRGYQEAEFHIIETEDGDFLCYDVMIRRRED